MLAWDAAYTEGGVPGRGDGAIVCCQVEIPEGCLPYESMASFRLDYRVVHDFYTGVKP
jgi:hypothetical protein